MSSPSGPDRDPAGCAAFFEMALDHLCIAGFDGYWKRLNPSWSRTLGWTDAELMAVPLVDFVHPDDRHAVIAARSDLTHGTPLFALVNRYRCKDGSYRWFEWRSTADVERQLVYAIARDVTQAREMQDRLQRQLMRADRMASVGTLAAGVAHEINNPLAYVISNLDLIAEELRAAGDTRGPVLAADALRLVAEAREGAERIRKIVRGLKTFSQDATERRAVVDVRAVLERAVEVAANEIRHRAQLVKELGPVPPVEADEALLGQVFLSLLVNAAQAIGAGTVDANEIRITTATDQDGRAAIEVRDTGCGIAPEVLEHMFEPFFTTKPVVGTGLGLSICLNVVTSLGGEITAANREGGGACMRIVLPAAPPKAETAPSAGPAPAVAGRRASVLVVDDERAVGTTLARLLRGHQVSAVTSAREALDLLSGGARFDVIISDLMMPGMSGMELHAEVSRRWPPLARRMVFMTGGAFTNAAKAFLESVPNERLEKPFSIGDVRALVARFAEG